MKMETLPAPDDAIWHQAILEHEEEIVGCLKRCASGTQTLNDVSMIAAFCGLADEVFPRPKCVNNRPNTFDDEERE